MPELLFNAFRAFRKRFHNTGLGRLPGVKGLYRFIYNATRPRDVVLAEVQGSKMFVDPNEKIHHPELIMTGIVDPAQTELFRNMIKPGMIVLDIGANIGYYTCLAARLLNGTGHVYSFEPFPRNFELLRRNIDVNHYTNVTAVNKAVGGETGRVKFYLDRDSALCHSMAPRPTDGPAPYIEVDVVSLDDYFGRDAAHQRVDLIKMDAECAEGLIINGARRLLANGGIQLFMEFNAVLLPNMGTDPQELLKTIKSLGFQLNLINPATGSVEEITPEAAYALSMRLGGHIELLLKN